MRGWGWADEVQRHAEEIRKPHSSLSGSRQSLQNVPNKRATHQRDWRGHMARDGGKTVTGQVSVHTQFADNTAHGGISYIHKELPPRDNKQQNLVATQWAASTSEFHKGAQVQYKANGGAFFKTSIPALRNTYTHFLISSVPISLTTTSHLLTRKIEFPGTLFPQN